VFVRRAGVWLTQPRFAVTAGAVVCDERGRVLLLKHVLRKGSGWGVPGGFLNAASSRRRPYAASCARRPDSNSTRRAGLRARARARPSGRDHLPRRDEVATALARVEKGFEIDRAEWFARDSLPDSSAKTSAASYERALSR
jgi:hypothetical protein